MYVSNIARPIKISRLPRDSTVVLVGNSADSSNNHFEALDALSKFADDNVMIYCPLSYGDQDYARKVAEYGERVFGKKFVPIFDFIKSDDYLSFLNSIDIAVFFHRRQQGMGNIISLLGLGKKVFISTQISTWPLFKRLGVELFDLDNINLEPIDDQVAVENQKRICSYFSEDNLRNQLRKIFSGG